MDRKRIVAATSLALLAMPAWAADKPELTALGGKCTSVVAADRQLDENACMPKLINLTLPNGREGFLFVLRKTQTSALGIGFFGNGQQEIHQEDHVVLPVDHVDITFNGTTSRAAAGSCTFANPNKGVPVSISCSADTADGKFVIEFLSDGSRPEN